jgi:hypothetical protein
MPRITYALILLLAWKASAAASEANPILAKSSTMLAGITSLKAFASNFEGNFGRPYTDEAIGFISKKEGDQIFFEALSVLNQDRLASSPFELFQNVVDERVSQRRPLDLLTA